MSASPGASSAAAAPPRILTIDTALVALVCGGTVLAVRTDPADRGHAARLPALAAAVLAEAGAAADLISVVVGPGSFTGLRAALGLAHGLAAGYGCPLVGVTLAEVLTHGVAGPVWTVLHSRPGRVFLIVDGQALSLDLDQLPPAPPGLRLVGAAAAAVAQRLGAGEVIRGDGSPSPLVIAAIGQQRQLGILPPCPAQPLYVDPPQVQPVLPA